MLTLSHFSMVISYFFIKYFFEISNKIIPCPYVWFAEYFNFLQNFLKGLISDPRLFIFWFISPLIFTLLIFFYDVFYPTIKKKLIASEKCIYILRFKKLILYFFVNNFIITLFFLYIIDFKVKSSSCFFFTSFLLNTPYLTIYTMFNLNTFSLIFIILTNIIILLSIIWSWNFNWNTKNLFLFFLFLDFLLKGCFCSHDIFTFFIFFESILLSMLFFIGILGLHDRKVKAVYLFYVYTLFGSFFMLLSILIIIFEIGNSGVLSITNYNLTFKKQIFLWPLLTLSFFIKIPVWPFHLWLPEAHVEASTLGSVFLASILLKLGGYGLIKFVLPLLPFACLYFTPLIETISCIGFFYCSICALRQLDIKKIIAYSSVVHMHLVLFALFSFNLKGLVGSILLMISHGLTSAGIFFCLGALYERFLTRNIFSISGIATFMPIFTGLLFILILSNTGFPGTINYISEFLCLSGIFLLYKSLNLIFVFLGLVINTYYNFWFYNRIAYGVFRVPKEFVKTIYDKKKKMQDLTKRESFILGFLVFWIIFLGFWPNILIKSIENFVLFLSIHISN